MKEDEFRGSVAAEVTRRTLQGNACQGHQGWLPWSSPQFSLLETLGGLSSYFMKDGKAILLQELTPLLTVILGLNHMLSVARNCPGSKVLCSVPSTPTPTTPASQPHRDIRVTSLIALFLSQFIDSFWKVFHSTFPVNPEFNSSFIRHFSALCQSAIATLHIINPESV